MSVPPKFAGLKLSASAPQESQHTLELCMFELVYLQVNKNVKLTISRP